MQFFTQSLILVFVVSTMFGVGLMLGVREIVASLQDRRWLVRALLANFILLPVLAYGVARLLQLDALLTAALLILATAPGGPVLIKLAALAKADHAHAVALLVILLLLGVVTQPLLLPLLLGEVRVDAQAIVSTLITTILLPLLVGLMLRARLANVALKLQLTVQRLSTLSMLLIWIALPVQHWQELLDISSGAAFPAAALFILLAASMGWLIGGQHPGSRRLLSLSCSQPNLAAAVVIASQNFSDPRVILMLLVVLLASVPLLLPLCLIYARSSSRSAAA